MRALVFNPSSDAESQLLSVLLARIGTAVRLDGADGRVLRWNDAYLRFFPEQAGALHIGAMAPETRLDARCDGRRYEADSQFLPCGGRLTLWTDVTARRAEEELARKTATLEALLEHLDQGVIMYDAEGRCVAWNRRAQEQLDLPDALFADSPTLNRVRDYQISRGEFGPDARQLPTVLRADDSTKAALRGHPIAYERQRPNGMVLEIRANVLPDGGLVFSYTDITAHKRAEEELRAAKERAEHALSDLRNTQESLIQAEKMASLAQLVAGVAHEVNTPIGVTLTAISHLGEEIGKIRGLFSEGRVRKSDFQEFLDISWESTRMILANIQRAAELIQSFKQVAVDQASAERRAFDLRDYVGEVLLSLHPRLRKSKIKIVADIPADLVVDGYPGAFSQVLSNLVINALVHAYDEGQEGRIALTAREFQPGWVELRYRDDGKGIPTGVRPRVFDPFFTTKRGLGASGLGLNICYNIMTGTMKGSIAVESEEGRGTSFILKFPRKVPEESGPVG